MRHGEFVRIAAIAIDAEKSWLEAHVFVTGFTYSALPAADPRIHQPDIADRDALGFRAERHHFADGLMTHGQRQRHTAIL